MFCVQCGKCLEERSAFCERCGKNVKGRNPQAQSLKSKLPRWVQGCFIISVFVGILWYYSQPVLPKVMEAQLDAIRQNQLTEAYYAYTSKDFQKKMGFLAFKELLNKHPSIAHNKSYHINDKSLHNNSGMLKVTLLSKKNEEGQAIFRFVKEKGAWKISKMRLLGSNATVDEEEELEMKHLIEGHLKALKGQDIVTAYYEYTSKEFQQVTEISVFQEFTEHFKIFEQYETLSFTHFFPKENEAKWTVALSGKEGEIPFEFHLKRQGNEWKISGVQISNPLENPIAKPVSPEDLVQQMLKAIRNHEFTKAYFDFTSKDFQKATSLKEFKQFLKGQPAYCHNRKSMFQIVTEAPSFVTIAGTLTSMEADELTVEYNVILEKEQWKVSHLQVKCAS